MLRKISISNRIRPFSHTPGIRCLIPGSHLILRAYPTRIEVGDLGVLSFYKTGKVQGWTVQLDLDKSVATVFGKGESGFFRLEFTAGDGHFAMRVDRAPESGIEFDWKRKSQTLNRKEEFTTGSFKRKKVVFPRLSFGMHKKQLFPRVLERGDLREILPLWVALGWGLEDKNRSFDFDFSDAILPGFSDLFVPCQEKKHLGYEFPEMTLDTLASGARKTVSMFLGEKQGEIVVVNEVFPEFSCGRLIGVQALQHQFDLEWTKKRVRRMIIHAGVSGPLTLRFPPGTKRFRMNGIDVPAGQPLELEEGKDYFLDRFQH